MPIRVLRFLVISFFVTLVGTTVTHAQAIVEYGAITANSAGAAASARPLIPMPNIGIPGSPSGAGSASGPAGAAGATPEQAAKANLQFFQTHAGPNAAQIALRAAPDHASVWIDGRFVGLAPLNLKVAPGHHQVLVRAPNMHESMQNFDLAAKQTQSIDVALKAASQTQVMVHWPGQK